MIGQSSNLPKSVTVRFQSRRCSGAVTTTIPAWYTKEFTIEEVGALEDVEGHEGSKWFHDRALALFTGGGTTPTNKTALDTLANQIASDFYNWHKESFDESYVGIIAPILDGLTDTIEWNYTSKGCTTRRYSAAYNDDPEELMHHDPANSGCTDSGGNVSEKTPCFESYGPPGGSSGNITLQVFKNCMEGGVLSQKYVRTESLGCGCTIARPVWDVIVQSKCPTDPSVVVGYPNVTVKLYKGSTFIQNGVRTQRFPTAVFFYRFGTLAPTLVPGNDYHIEVDDTYPNYHQLISPNFTIDNILPQPPYPAWPTFDIFHWLGWARFAVRVEPVCAGGPMNSDYVEVKATQNVNEQILVPNFIGNFAGGPFLEYDPSTYIPYDVFVQWTPVSDRINPRGWLFKWSDIASQCICKVYGTTTPSDPFCGGDILYGTGVAFPMVFNTASCGNCTTAPPTQGDIADGYICYGTGNQDDIPCLPVKKSITLEDSKYGMVGMSWVECPPNSDYWNNVACGFEGEITVMSEACDFDLACDDPTTPVTEPPVAASCPSVAVTIKYCYTVKSRPGGGGGQELNVYYKIHNRNDCPPPRFAPNVPYICAGTGTDERWTNASASPNLDIRKLCYPGFIDSYTIMGTREDFFCQDQFPGATIPPLFTIGMYIGGATITILED